MRLIDANELMEHIWRDRLDSREAIAEMVNNAPTVRNATWISVNDRLPELYVDVLVFTKGGTIVIDYLDVDAMVYENFHNHWNYVTHWMPLPQKPESEDDEYD